MLHRVAHIDLGREMKHQLGLDLREDLGDRVGLAHVGDPQRDPIGDGRLEVHALAGGEVVDDGDPVAPSDQCVGQVRANETGTTGDDAFHDVPAYGAGSSYEGPVPP
jgi:hypothetical protein